MSPHTHASGAAPAAHEWPKRGVWVPSAILTATDEAGQPLPATIRDTWVCLRALAGSKEKLEITFDELETLIGKSRSPVLAHLATLRDRCGLRFRTSAGDSRLQVHFHSARSGPAPEILKSGEKSQNQDSHNSLKQESINSKTLKNLQILKSGEKSQNQEPRPPATMRAIQDAYISLLGYDPGHWANGESRAARQIASCFTVVQLEETYRHYKAQPFWSDKHLTLRYLVQQMPEYFKNRAPRAARHELTPDEIQAIRAQMRAQQEPHENPR